VSVRRLLAGTLIVVLAGLLTPTSAVAQESPSPTTCGYAPPTATVTPLGNETIRVEGGCCAPKSDVVITVTLDETGAVIGEKTVKAANDGTFKATINIGKNVGPATVTIVCGTGTGAVTVVRGITLFRDTGAAAANLAVTGDDTSIPLARLSVILLAAGGLAVYAARKRSSRGAKALTS
jgi:hypothetical protein